MLELADIRRAAGMTQEVQLAANLGVGQAHVSKIERQDDMLISTLAAYLDALGADAQIVVEVAQQTITFDLSVWMRKR